MILPFAVPDLEIELVDAELNNINDAFKALWQANKYHAFTVENSETGRISYRVKLPDITPTILSRYSKVMTNLKHILDQSVNASYFITTGEESSKLHFPNGSTEVNFNASMNGRPLALLSTSVRDIIMKHKPFKGGNDALYTMCKFARIKHRPIYLDVKPMISETFFAHDFIQKMSIRTKRIDSDGCYELATAPIGANKNVDFGVRYAITLLEQGPLFQKNALVCAFDLLDEVRAIHNEIKIAST